MFASAQLLRNCREPRPSIQGGLDLSVTWEVGTVYYGQGASNPTFVPQYITAV